MAHRILYNNGQLDNVLSQSSSNNQHNYCLQDNILGVHQSQCNPNAPFESLANNAGPPSYAETVQAEAQAQAQAHTEVGTLLKNLPISLVSDYSSRASNFARVRGKIDQTDLATVVKPTKADIECCNNTLNNENLNTENPKEALKLATAIDDYQKFELWPSVKSNRSIISSYPDYYYIKQFNALNESEQIYLQNIMFNLNKNETVSFQRPELLPVEFLTSHDYKQVVRNIKNEACSIFIIHFKNDETKYIPLARKRPNTSARKDGFYLRTNEDKNYTVDDKKLFEYKKTKLYVVYLKPI